MLSKHLAVNGIVKIGDLVSDNGKFLESEKLLQARLSPVHYFKLMGIVNSFLMNGSLSLNKVSNISVPPRTTRLKLT